MLFPSFLLFCIFKDPNRARRVVQRDIVPRTYEDGHICINSYIIILWLIGSYNLVFTLYSVVMYLQLQCSRAHICNSLKVRIYYGGNYKTNLL